MERALPLPPLGSWGIQQLRWSSALKVPNDQSSGRCSEQPKPSKMRPSTNLQKIMGLLGTKHMAAGDRKHVQGAQADPITGLLLELSHSQLELDQPATSVFPLFKTHLGKAAPKPYTCTVRETRLSLMGSISAPPPTPDLI